MRPRTANRIVRLTRENVSVLEPLIRLQSGADDYLFTNVQDEPIDASNFAEIFRRARRALGLRLRKFYSTKHTYISLALTRGVNITWLSEQTGVAVTTLLEHYGKFIHTLDADRVELSEDRGRRRNELPTDCPRGRGENRNSSESLVGGTVPDGI